MVYRLYRHGRDILIGGDVRIGTRHGAGDRYDVYADCIRLLRGYIIIAKVLLPLYYKLQLTSIYSYLDDRIGRRGYKTGASFFLLSKIRRGGRTLISSGLDLANLRVQRLEHSHSP